MRAAGLVGYHRRRRRGLTRRDPQAAPAPDLVERRFMADQPDRVWTADITYIPAWSGWLYLAIVLDIYSRRVVGWSMADHLRLRCSPALTRPPNRVTSSCVWPVGSRSVWFWLVE
jgi:putative transposase